MENVPKAIDWPGWAVCEMTPGRSPVGGADGVWRGAYKWSNKPLALVQKMPSRLF